MKSRLLALAFCFLSGALSASAQLQVDLSIKRNLFVMYEPILATVSITNLSGRDITLRDDSYKHWFGLEVQFADGRPLPPNDPNYSNEPVTIPASGKISRTVNLTPLFPLTEFGNYRVRAIIFSADVGRFFQSPALGLAITDGRSIWQKTVGSPDDGSTRTITLLSHRLPSSTQLYIRIEDREKGVIYCTHQLGRFLTFGNPDILLDRKNEVHILQNTAPKSYVYSHIGLNGQVIERKAYNEFSTRPAIRRTSDGGVTVVGGQEFDPNAPPPEQSLPSLDERPVAVPGGPTPVPKDEKRPDNLLSR